MQNEPKACMLEKKAVIEVFLIGFLGFSFATITHKGDCLISSIITTTKAVDAIFVNTLILKWELVAAV